MQPSGRHPVRRAPIDKLAVSGHAWDADPLRPPPGRDLIDIPVANRRQEGRCRRARGATTMSPHRLLRQRAATTRPAAARAGRPTVDVEGGRAVVAQRVAHLTGIQPAFVVALAVRTRDESMLDELVRGYAPSPWLIAVLPWETATPSANHLRQVLRRTRASLAAGGIGDLFESRRGFGYRPRVIPGPASTGW